MRGRGVAAGAVVVAALAVVPAGGTAAAASGDVACVIGPTGLHRISARTHITCVGAKHVLLSLRGRREFVPMVCGSRSRTVGAWRVTPVRREPAAIVNRFTRGSVSFVYKRSSRRAAVACLP